MVIAVFETGERTINVCNQIWQYNYGQILRIQGLNLPPAVEVHFSLQDTGGTSITRIGITKDGVTEAPIPDSMLENEDVANDYSIYAFVYLTDETSGQTEYKITLKVKARPKPEIPGGQDEPTLAEIMKAVNEIASGKADGLEYENNILKLLSGDRELARVTIQGGSGTDAREIELRKYETAIQWRYAGEDTWKDLVQLSEITGGPGKDGITPHIGDNGNWHIGNEDTGKPSRGENATDEQVQQAVDNYMQGVDFDTKFNEKLDKNQGAEHAGKALVVGEDGNVVPGEAQGGTVDLDTTLTQPGKAADAKATGDKILQFAIKNTMQGESPLVVADSAEEKVLGLEVFGKTEQVQTTGAQLFTIKRQTNVGDTKLEQTGWTKDNVSEDAYSIQNNYQKVIFTVTDEATNSFTIESASQTSSNGCALEVPLKVDASTTYTISANQNFAEVQIKEFDEEISKTGSSFVKSKNVYTFTTKETTAWVILRFCAVVKTKVVVQNFQFQKGSTATHYEPYTGGKPSPSPAYPQEIVNAGRLNEDTGKYEVDVKVTGKNLIPFPYPLLGGIGAKGTKNGVTWEILKDRGIKLTGKATEEVYIDIFSSQELQDKEKFAYSKDLLSDARNGKIFYAPLVGQSINAIYYPQIERGTVATEYETYKEPQTILLTSDRPITKWDKLVEQDGEIGWLYQTSKYVVTGEETFSINVSETNDDYIYGDTTNAYILLQATALSKLYTYANKLMYKDSVWSDKTGAEGYCFNAGNKLHIRLLDTRLGVNNDSSVEEVRAAFKAFMKKEYESGNPFEFCYKTPNQEFVPLPQEEQEAICALTTYYPTTVIVTDGRLNPDVELSYVADTRNFILGQIKEIAKKQLATDALILERTV